MHRQGDDQQGLIQAAVVELRGLAERLGDKFVSVLEFIQHREIFGIHT